MLFDDGVSRIDYVLAWEVPEKEDEDALKAKNARKIFEKNLIEEGLSLEYDTVWDLELKTALLFNPLQPGIQNGHH